MEVGSIVVSAAMTTITLQLQTTTEMQMAVMKQLAESQQRMADMLQSLGIGQAIDLQA